MNAVIRPCMGGRCLQRDRCVHYTDPSTRSAPAERLCATGHEAAVAVEGVRHLTAKARRLAGTIDVDSRIWKVAQKIAERGAVDRIDLQRLVLSESATKEQANALRSELNARGLLRSTFSLTPKAASQLAGATS